ncbi:hypothetical protein AAG570_006481 [Ranatra chinensis]|uniref:N-terminal acetyltransferase B complex subunit NAA25 homolog n=1 Tax=Ranatra chinensis TaxID=642074 RepID=A0ABD0Z4Q3_9HEMI
MTSKHRNMSYENKKQETTEIDFYPLTVMASKLNNYPVERRLRPIYESLDTGNNKKALQEAEKVLRRQPGLLCAKALKCLALLRMGKESDCVELLEAVRKEEPVDDATLQAMTVCYREIHKPQVICEMYRLAYEKDPGNEEMLMHLFFSYARISDYNKQQQTAMALYKLRPKNQYYFWAIMSNLLQTRETAQEIMEYCLPPLFREDGVSKKVNQLTSSQNVCLKLSAKMIDRYLDKISSEQEILLWFVIQEMQGKLDEALKALEGPFGGKQPEICVRNRKADLLLKLGNWEEACRILRSLTDEFQDNWKYMKCYIFTVFRSWEVSKDAAEIKSATSFLNFNVTRGQQSTVPLLGWLEFYCELKRRQLPTHGLDIVWVLMKYMRGFGAADCSLHNLKPYLPYLSSVEAKDFLNQVWSLVALGKAAYNELRPANEKQHWRQYSIATVQ